MHRSKEPPIRIIPVAFGALLLLTVPACGDEGASPPTATLQVLAGTVEVDSGSGTFEPASSGLRVETGMTVRTGPDGRAEIEWFDGSRTRLDYSTTFRVARMEWADGATVITGEHTTGRTYSFVVAFTDAGSRFDIETPSAIASVQGTEYALFIEEDGTTTLVVLDQSVRLESAVGSATIEAGFSLTFGPPATMNILPEPAPTPTDLLDSDWIQFNQSG